MEKSITFCSSTDRKAGSDAQKSSRLFIGFLGCAGYLVHRLEIREPMGQVALRDGIVGVIYLDTDKARGTPQMDLLQTLSNGLLLPLDTIKTI